MNTNVKGDIAKSKIITDLVVRGVEVFVPISEHGVVDLVGIFNDKSLRFQCKYSSNGRFTKGCTFYSGGKVKTVKYEIQNFDFYAIYISEIDKCVYIPNNKEEYSKVFYTPPNFSGKYLWYEDYLNIIESNDLILRTSEIKRDYKPIEILRKVDRPSKEKLSKLLWEKPTTQIAKEFGVSDKAINKWAKTYQISKPPRGYWTGKHESKV